MILERILEESGLRKDEEYYSQASGIEIRNDEDKRLRPDIVIRLPENKHLIIDSKVSLISYEAYSSSETEDERINNGKNLITSIRTHVDNLSQKHYQSGKNINSPDFVLMFIPIEASFSVALQIDKQLFQHAWNRKVMIVTPTTLMATLWTISSIWRQENQTKNTSTKKYKWYMVSAVNTDYSVVFLDDFWTKEEKKDIKRLLNDEELTNWLVVYRVFRGSHLDLCIIRYFNGKENC